MSSRKKYDAVATIGAYTANGVEKKRYLNVGSVFENEDGRLSLKLDALPTSREWTGWIAFYDPKPRDESTAAAPARAERPAVTTKHEFDDDIPF